MPFRLLPSTINAPTAARTLADFTSPGMVVPQLRSRDAAGVIQERSQAMQREKRIPDLLRFYHAALNRELLMGSDWEAGMAFPHVRLPALKEVSFAPGRSPQTLSSSGKAVHSVRLVFLIAVPATDSTQYLSLSSGLARLAGEERLVKKLQAAQAPLSIIEVLEQIELRTNPVSDLMGEVGGIAPSRAPVPPTVDCYRIMTIPFQPLRRPALNSAWQNVGNRPGAGFQTCWWPVRLALADFPIGRASKRS